MRPARVPPRISLRAPVSLVRFRTPGFRKRAAVFRRAGRSGPITAEVPGAKLACRPCHGCTPAGHSVRGAGPHPAAWLRVRGHAHARAGNRRQQCDLHRRQRRGSRAAAVSARGSAGAGHGRSPGPGNDRHRHVGARAVRLPRSGRGVRRDRRPVSGQRKSDRGRPARARRGAARESRATSPCSACSRRSAASSTPGTTFPASPRWWSSATPCGSAGSAAHATCSGGRCASTMTAIRSWASCRPVSDIPGERCRARSSCGRRPDTAPSRSGRPFAVPIFSAGASRAFGLA